MTSNAVPMNLVPRLAIPPNTNLPYLIVIVIMVLVGVSSIVTIILLRPGQDNANLFVAIGGFCLPTIAALLAFLKTQETHLLVNSRMDEFKALLAINAATAAKIARAEGIADAIAGKIV